MAHKPEQILPTIESVSSHMDAALGNSATMIALANAATQTRSIDGAHHLVLPPGYSTQNITEAVEQAQPTPARKRGQVVLHSAESLLAYCKDQDAAATGYIFADPDKCCITAVFNHHRGSAAGWRDHRATFTAAHTPEYQTWARKDKQPMTQGEFAEFIEDNLADITEPFAQQLLDVATTIQAKTDITFASAKRLQDGQNQLTYTETIDARAGVNGALAVPKEFSLGLRIFKQGAGYKLRARLKLRLTSGGVKFWYELDRPQRAVEDAFAEYVATLREQSGYQVLMGTQP